MKHVILGIVCSIVCAALAALACQFIGWEHPSTWGAHNRLAAVVMVCLGAAAGALLGAWVSEKLS